MSHILRWNSEGKLILANAHNTSLENHVGMCVYLSWTSGCSWRCGGDVTSEYTRWFSKMSENWRKVQWGFAHSPVKFNNSGHCR